MPRNKVVDGHKVCTVCGQNKPIEEYYYNKTTGDLFGPCKPCNKRKSTEWRKNNHAKSREQARRWYDRNPDFNRRKWLARYGLTIEAYEALVKAQAGRCAICKKDLLETKHRHIDHCHTTGRVRGLLCNNCNLGIGNLQEDPAIMRAAIAYLSSVN